MRALLTLVGVGCFGCGLALAACGGATSSSLTGVDSGGADGTTEAGLDGSSGGDVTSTDGGDGGMATETGTPCAAPGDPTKSAMCLTIVPESITFTSDPKFDGKGWLVAQVFDTATPTLSDGGEVPALATMELPPGGQDAGSIDLSQPIQVLRFDGLPATVYTRVVFLDDPAPNPQIGASTWLAGFDFSKGLLNDTPLVAESLPTGAGTNVSLHMIALREMTITMNRTVTPAGNGEGPATVVATPDQVPTSTSALFGVGENACARVDGTNTAQVTGFVFGKGPYYIAGQLDDFGLGDGGVSLPPGALVSLDLIDGGYELPAADLMTYAPTAYRVSQTISLNLVVPGAPGTDTVSCP
jgi:hypothetical protein